jgi:hypothetical protein
MHGDREIALLAENSSFLQRQSVEDQGRPGIGSFVNLCGLCGFKTPAVLPLRTVI